MGSHGVPGRLSVRAERAVRMRVLAGLLLLVLALPCRAATPSTAGLDFTQHPGATVPLDASFTAADGEVRSLRQWASGKPAVLILGYFHCPSLCGVLRDDAFAALAGSGLTTPGDYTVLDVSIDPHETVADAARARADDLQRYAVPGAVAGWHFLIGQAADVAAIAASVGFHSRWDDQLQQFLHPAGMVVLTPAGHVSAYLLGVGATAAALHDALLAAHDEVVAPPAPPILLYCFHYDSTTGRYTLVVEKVLQLGAAMIILVIGSLFVYLQTRKGPASP